METTGDFWEIGGEVTLKWIIKDFFPLSHSTSYQSSKFYFSGASWDIKIYTNDEAKVVEEGWIGLYIMRRSTGHPILLDVSCSIKSTDEKLYINGTFKGVLDKKNCGSGFPKILSPPFLMKKKSEFNASNDLVVICTLKNNETKAVTESLFYRQQDICNNLQDIYVKSKKADFRLQVGGRKILAHRIVLETRSPVFGAMLRHDTKENQTNEVSVDDVDLDSIHNILLYMYTGDIGSLKTENVLSIYAAAEKYDLKEVKKICSSFIKRNLSVEWICDVIEFIELYQDETIRECCTEYFQKNANKIIETDNWKTFSKENHDISVEFLEMAVKTLFKN